MTVRNGVACLALILALSSAACGKAGPASTPTSVDDSVPSGLWPRVANFAYDSTRSEIVLFGGLNGNPTNDTWAWNGIQWSRRTPATNPPAQLGAALTDDPDHHVVLMFGSAATGSAPGTTWLWNGSDWRQVFPAHSPSSRAGAAITYDPVHHVALLFGGSNGNPMNDTWVWDGSDWTPKTPETSPPARYYARLAFDIARGNAVLYGGFGGLDDTWTWDGITWTERHPSNTPPGLSEATPYPQQMAYDAARKVIAFVNITRRSSRSADDTAGTWTWDGTTWTSLTTTTPVRYDYGLAYDARRSVIVLAGGWAQSSTGGLSTWGWNGASWSRLAGPANVPPAPSPSIDPQGSPKGLWPRTTNFAYDSSRSQVILFGGAGGGDSNDTWTWDGVHWTERVSSTNPSARHDVAITDDPYHHVVLLFGGAGGTKFHGDTWLWNGSDWNEVFPAHSPSPRAGAAITYDPVRHVVLLFGGDGLNDTWIWDGTDWTEKTSVTTSATVASGSRATSPPGRSYARLAFDIAHGEAVLFGGFGGPDDTWTWNGSAWTAQHPANTPPRPSEFTPVPQQMVYDAARKVMVFVEFVPHSGLCTETTMDTWTWDGSNWSRVPTSSSPPLRAGNGLAYDEKHSLTVFAGGGTCSNLDESSTWGWNGSTWSKIG